MIRLKSLFLICLYCNFVSGAHEKEQNHNRGVLQPKSYFGFLNEATQKIQLINSNGYEQTTKTLGYVVSTIHKAYQPLEQILADGYSKLNGYEKFTSNSIPPGDNENVLNNLHEKIFSLRDGLNTSSSCINDTGRLIAGLVESQTWAVQFFDASGKPGPGLLDKRFGFVGDYDECKSARAPSTTVGYGNMAHHNGEFEGNYCIISFLTEIPFLAAALGACMPSTCSADEITYLMYDILGYPKLQPPIVGITTQCLTSKTKVTTATVIAILILSLIGIFMFFGTIYDILTVREEVSTPQEQTESLIRSRRIRHNTSYESIASLTDKEWNKTPTNSDNAFFDRTRKSTAEFGSVEHGTFAKILLAFSVYSNSKKILNTRQSSGSLGAIHGIRFLSMSWVMLCHLYTNVFAFAMNSLDVMSGQLKRWTFLPIANGFVSVDTFFTLSGLLTSYLTIQEMSKRNTWKINWPMFYFHRFWRLTPPYMFSIMIFLGLQQYMGKGPLWSDQQPYDKEYCENNWWTNLLYINNLVKHKEICFGHSWYLANDMQFFVLSPLMLIPFYYSRFAGVVSCLFFILVSWITTGTLSSSHKWPTTSLTLKPVPGHASQSEWMEHYYVVPWCRIGPFVVGVIAGYILALTKGRPFRMHWLMVGVGWITALASGFAIVYGIRGDITGDNPSSINASAFYNAVHRTVWGACVSWVVVACSAGYGGPVTKLLSWSPFVVLGRLTYMSYLIHLNIMAIFFGNFGALYFANDSTMVIMYLGILVFVNMVAFVCVLALESPMVGLEKTFIRKGKKDG